MKTPVKTPVETPVNPTAKPSMKTPKLERFWQKTEYRQDDRGWCITLDDRVVKTPAGAAFAVPSETLIKAIRDEWDEQTATIEPASMPMFGYAVTAIDRVGPQRSQITDEIAGYAASDLVCYRASDQDDQIDLARQQEQNWQPHLDWLSAQYGVRLITVQGLMPKDQPPEALTAIHSVVSSIDDFSLAGLFTLVKVSGSLVLSFAVFQGKIDAEQGFNAAFLDELWHADKWGHDIEAEKRRLQAKSDMHSSSRYWGLVKEE